MIRNIEVGIFRTRVAWRTVPKALSPVHTGDKVEFNTVDFVKSRQSQPCCFGPVHTGDKVDRTGNKFDRIGDKVDRVGDRESCRIQVVADLSPKPATKSTVSAIVDFVAGFGNSRLRRQCVPGFTEVKCDHDDVLMCCQKVGDCMIVCKMYINAATVEPVGRKAN